MNSLPRKTKMQFRTFVFALNVLAVLAVFAGIEKSAQAQTSPVAFPAPTTFALNCIACGNNPTYAVATGDFNKDGKLDVVAVGDFQAIGNQVMIELGNGDGTFQTPIINTQQLHSFDAVAVGDFNGDGLLDVAVWGAGNADTEVSIFLGNGTGSLTYSATYSAPSSNNFVPGPSSVVASDVNGDGKLDLVALTPYNGVYVFLGKGDGTFQSPTNSSLDTTSSPALAVAVADLNGDGKPDLAVYVNTGIGVLLNTGSGTFGAPSYYAASGFFRQGHGIAIGDINGDKKPDIVIPGSLPGTGAVAVFLNQGSGTFAFNSTVATGGPTDHVVLVDINGDKKLDLVALDDYGEVWTFFGKGNGTFTNGPGYPLQGSTLPTSLVLGDFNGDGALDLLEQDASQPLALVTLGRGDGTFQTNQFYGHANTGSGDNIVTADFNGDGIPDIAYSNAQPPAENRTDFAIMLGSSHGALANPTYVAAVAAPCLNAVEWIATGDVNGDGKADIVATLKFYGLGGCPNNMVAVFTGLGTGKFKKPVYYPTGTTTAQEFEVFLVDVNGDGKLDIVTSNSDGTISVLLNKGNGTYNAGTLTTGMTAINAADNQLAFGDFNGDGKMDIAVTTGGTLSDVYVLLGKGDGTFGSPIQTVTPYNTVTAAAADFNKDGKIDLLVTTSGGGCNTFDTRGYAFLKGNGDGTFTAGPVNCTTGGYSEYPVVADFNGDGKLDAFISYGASTLGGYGDAGPTILQGNGDGTFTQLTGPFYVGSGSQQAAVADFNGDGVPDVAVMDNDGSGNFVTVMQNSSQPVSVSPLKVNYGSVTVGAKKPETVILTNDQKTTLAITSVTVAGTDAGDFGAKSTCGTSRKPGWDCTITVTFTPAAIGVRTATLSIKDAVGTQTVQLNGTGK